MLDALLACAVRHHLPLEEALEHIWWDHRQLFSYLLSDSETVEAPAYILPGGFDDSGFFHGLFSHKGNLVKVPFGVSWKSDGLQKYYHMELKKGGSALFLQEQWQPIEKVVYLPLATTSFSQSFTFGLNSDKKPLVKGPFPILGVESHDPPYPLLLAVPDRKAALPKDEKKPFVVKESFYGFFSKPSEGNALSHYFWETATPNTFWFFLTDLFQAKNSSAKAFFFPRQKKEPAPLTLDPLVLEEKLNWNKPQNIIEYLDRFVVGQVEAKKKMAIVFSLYMKRAQAETESIALPKGHLVLIGPPGVGKTYMTDLLVEKAELPVAKTSVTGKSAAGYVDESLSTVFSSFWAKTKGEEAPFGVIFIDEIDKVIHTEWRDDIFGPKQQEELIGWLGGTYVQIGTTERRSPIRMSTNNLLFITAGAFEGDGKRLAKIIAQRQGDLQGSISGFGREGVRPQKYAEQLQAVTPNDLIAYGLRPELVRRLPFIGVLDPLSVDDKIKILKGTEKSVIGRYQNLFALEGYALALDEAVYELLAKRSPPEVGASGLETACEQLFQEILFSTEEYADGAQSIRITPELAEKLLEKK
ncbi:AAA family ATPase [Candidatus Woesearchaeota archaeon]|nr:AAA family ATPase [Candidatus Woesearchaeota archaeon]